MRDFKGGETIVIEPWRAAAFPVGPRGEHVAQLLAVAMEQGMTAEQLLQVPYYHPVVEEMIQSALQDIARQLPHSELPLGLTPA